MYSPAAPYPGEPYGQVSASHLQHRRAEPTQSTPSPTSYYTQQQQPAAYTHPISYGQHPHATAAYSPYGAAASSPSLTMQPDQKKGYAHNTIILAILLPCIWILLTATESPYPLQTFLFSTLALHGADLANARSVVLWGTWLAAVVQTCVGSWFLLAAVDDDGDASSGRVLTLISIMTGTGLFWICAAAWTTLQLQWMVVADTSRNSLAVHLEQTLHSFLPPVAACILTNAFANKIEETMGQDAAAIAAPFVFAGSLTATMLWIGSCTKSFHQSDAIGARATSFVLSSRLAQGHIGLLLLTPAAMHVITSMGRILSSYASTDDFFDWVLVMTVPYLMLYILAYFSGLGLCVSPYPAAAQPILPGVGAGNTLRGAALPVGLAVLTSWALQQRYLLAICHSFSYHFMGAQSPTWLISLYWTAATNALCFAMFVWGRQSESTGGLLFGEYHEDIVQLALSLAGLALGKAFGLPWNFTPLPILAFLGLSLWITSRMLRYLAIFLFVVHATGVVIFTYRFAGIDSAIDLPLPGVKLSLARFGLVVVAASVMMGLVTGLAVRPSGGFAAKTLRRVDFAGFLFVLYSILLMILEITLLKRPVPTKELMGLEYEAEDTVEEEMLYDHSLAMLTSFVLIGITLFMQRVKILSARSSGVVISLAIGKAASLYIDAAEADEIAPDERTGGWEVFLRAIVASLLCIVIFAPRVFLEPVYLKTATRKRRAMGRGETDLPSGAAQTIFVYTFCFLPLALVAAVPYILYPLVGALAGTYQGDTYYSITLPVSELVGSTLALWGLSCLSMLNYYLPDGGGEVWKKLSALAFLMGAGIFFAAPTVGAGAGEAASNPYAAISSLGSQLISRGKSRTGGWGLLSATLATLLAVTGPLELKERKNSSGRQDSYLLFRTMTFSLMFGGGVAWFIIMQTMSEADILFLILTTVSCMTLAFLGTITAVLGYCLELENFDEVEQIGAMWMVALPLFLPVAGFPQLFQSGVVHPFGSGGWAFTYLVVCALSAISVSFSLRNRRSKNQTSRGLCNMMCVLSWGCAIAVLYGRYGVAGLDVNFDVTTFLGVPASILGTIVVAPILLALQGEKASDARGRIQRLGATSTKTPSGSNFILNLSNLKRSNKFYPLLAGTTLVFLCASVYAIMIRGSGLFTLLGDSSIARSHADLLAGVFGSAEGSKDEDDLAALAKKAMLHSQALTTSAKLAGSGFWTSDSFVGPVLHLAGLVAVLPSHFLLYRKQWLGKVVPTLQVTLALPLNAMPFVLCRGIPSLQAAALVGAAFGLMQVMNLQQADRQSKMRI